MLSSISTICFAARKEKINPIDRVLESIEYYKTRVNLKLKKDFTQKLKSDFLFEFEKDDYREIIQTIKKIQTCVKENCIEYGNNLDELSRLKNIMSGINTLLYKLSRDEIRLEVAKTRIFQYYSEV